MFRRAALVLLGTVCWRANVVGGQWSKDVSAFEVENDVLVLTEENIDEALAKYSPLMVDFYSPRCHYSNQLKPVWADAAGLMKWSLSPVTFAKFDLTTSDAVAERFEIVETPSIVLFRDGINSRFTGAGMTAQDIMDWTNLKSGPAYHVLRTVEDLTAFQAKHESVAVGVYADLKTAHAERFMEMAYKYDDKPHIAVTASDAIRAHLGLTRDTIVVLKAFENLRDDYPADGDFDLAHVRGWLDKKAVRMLLQYTATTSKAIFANDVKMHVLIFHDADAAGTADLLTSLRATAEDYVGRALFLTVDKRETRTFAYFESYLDRDRLPAVVVADMKFYPDKMPKYPLTGAVDAANVHALVGDVLNGTVKQTFKSQPLAPEDTQGPIIEVKGKSFYDLVIDNDKTVFLYIYSVQPQVCPKCSEMDDVWEAVAARFKERSDVVFAAFDGKQNEFEWRNFRLNPPYPKIYTFKAGSKEYPIEYGLMRRVFDEESLVTYVQKYLPDPNDVHDEL